MDKTEMTRQLREAADYVQARLSSQPEAAVILGTGLGGIAQVINVDVSIPYRLIPNFPVSTVEGHQGNLIIGTFGDKPIVAMQGRFHFYEGYDMWQVTLPVRVFKLCGINTLLVSNASGGLNPDFKAGTIMVIEDHINHFGSNPLIGPNLADLGPRFPDMSHAYSQRLSERAFQIAEKEGIKLERGVYVGTSGPTFETPSEYKMFRQLGGDAVGMSTVPEVIVARHAGMEVFGISVITNSGAPGEVAEGNHKDVQRVAAEAEPKLTKVIGELIRSL